MIPGPAGTPPEGGEAQLEADVMRFVAILALCLVAISTLVSAPIAEVSDAAVRAPVPAPAAPAEPAAARAQIPAPPEPAAVREPLAARPESFPEPASPAPSPAPSAPGGDAALPLLPPAVPAVQDAAAAPLAARPPAPTPPEAPAPDRADPAPDPGPAGAAPPAADPDLSPPARPAPVRRPVSDTASRGFVLRFESDAVLLRLAAAGRVGVYAMATDGALRLRLGPAGAEMVPGPTPARFHVMDPATVPPALRQALARAGAGAPERTWAVTLPDASRDALAELMRRYEDGELVIGPRGDVRRLAHEG